MTTFRQVISKIQDGLVDEAKVGLEFVLRLDPTFLPGIELQRQLTAGRESIDLTALLSHLNAPSTDTINLLLVEAVEEFNQRNYLEAKEKVGKVLLDLPGHTEARNLLGQIDESLKVETQVGQFLSQAREALDRDDPEEAANFVMMAQALDPHHQGIQAMLDALQDPSLSPEVQPEPSFQAPSPAAPQQQPTPEPAQDFPAVDSFDFSLPQQQAFGSADDADDADSIADADSWNIADAFDMSSADQADSGTAAEPSQPPALESDSDISDLFAVSDGADDPAPESEFDGFDFSPPTPDPPAPPAPSVPSGPSVPAQPAERSGPDFDDSAGDLGDLFQSDPDIGEPFADDGEITPADDPRTERVAALVDEANAAFEAGDIARAKDLIEDVLATESDRIDALDLIARIEAFEEPVVPDSAPLIEEQPPDDLVPESLPEPELHADAFANEFALPEDVASGVRDEIDAGRNTGAAVTGRAPRSSVPWRLIALIGGGIAIVLATMWLGSGLFSNNGDTEEERAQEVTRRLQEADALFKQGKTEEALHLLQTFAAEGIEKQRIDKRIARYEASMAPPPPTPIPQAFLRGRELIDQGQWLEAYGEVENGLRDHPDDSGLRELREEIADIESEIVPLHSSLGKGDYATAASIVAELEKKYPEQAGFADIRERCLFNAALTELRTYNLTAARNYLEQLRLRRPQDDDVVRILEFISSYSNRPVDMQLEIFVGSLESR